MDPIEVYASIILAILIVGAALAALWLIYRVTRWVFAIIVVAVLVIIGLFLPRD
jgi:hypothetical protein